MVLPRHIAPAGTPIGAATLLGAGVDGLLGRDADRALTEAICSRYGVRHCMTLSSGRAALTLILRALVRLRNDPRRNQIIVPGYTCYSVAAAAILAGLELRILDIDPATLSYRRDRLEASDFSRVLAVVSANLYGLPNELDYLERLAAAQGVYMIDDAAQSMHATLQGRYAGTFGDVGLYSFDKGKNITCLQGGAIVTRDDGIAAALREMIRSLPREAATTATAGFFKLAAYALLLRPELYWIPASIPALGLGKTVYTTDIPMHRLGRVATALVNRLFKVIDDISAQRIAAAKRISAVLKDTPQLTAVMPVAESSPVYLRFPCLAENTAQRDLLVRELNRNGIGATASFPQALCDLEEIAGHVTVGAGACEGARAVAQRVLTLPTLAYLRDVDIERLAGALHRTLRPGRDTC
ncbi:MAG: DegT/DnrJ/EryC1/StrS family aminotransferase [Thiohalobacteraceae bacterium]